MEHKLFKLHAENVFQAVLRIGHMGYTSLPRKSGTALKTYLHFDCKRNFSSWRDHNLYTEWNVCES